MTVTDRTTNNYPDAFTPSGDAILFDRNANTQLIARQRLGEKKREIVAQLPGIAAMATALSVTNSAVQIPLLNFGSDAQKKKYLQRLATGEILGAFCLTEAQAGSDAAAIQTRASKHNDTYKLQGTKTWVTNGSAAGVFIVFAKIVGEAGQPLR